MTDVYELQVGDPVVVVADGRSHRVTVQRAVDPGEFAAPESRTVTVGFGPGRWNREVSNAAQRAGYVQLYRDGEVPA